MVRDRIGFWEKISDPRDPQSLAVRCRQKRMAFFKSLLDQIQKPIRILDVGGTEVFWETMGLTGASGISIVLLNLSKETVRAQNLVSLAGDARHMSDFRDAEFDVVFSNSVIEHVGDFRMQEEMASEIRRVGKRYFVQTPNRHFPMEPHFLFPCFQFFPRSARVFLIRHFSLGWYNKTPDRDEACRLADSIRLLSANELRMLFKDACVRKEKFFGFTKSFIAYGGWPQIRS